MGDGEKAANLMNLCKWGKKSELSSALNDIKMAKGLAGPDIEETQARIRMIKAGKAGPIWMGGGIMEHFK